MIRAVAYYRKSTEDEGESIAQQREDMTRACARDKVQVVREFEDQSVSGWDNERRSGFKEMIAFVEQQAKAGRPVEAVVCWHANRFSRADSMETDYYLHRLRVAGVTKMLTDKRWIDFNRSEDRMIFGLEQEASSHRFSVDLSAACKRGKRSKAARGLWTGGRPPYGYRVEGARFAIDPAAADVVRLMFDSYASGRYGLRALGEMLTTRGVHSPASNGLWAAATLRHILKNPAYLGHLVSNRKTDNRFLGAVKVPVSPATGKRKRYTHHPQGEWVKAADSHPAIITQEQFDRVQARFATNQRRTSPTKAFVLSGLVRCGGCEGTMIGRTVRDKRYYVCARYMQFGRSSGCHQNAVQEWQLVAAVANKMAEVYFNPATLNEVREEVRRQEQTPDTPNRVKQLTARIEELSRKVAVGMQRMTDLPPELYDEFKASLLATHNERTRLEQELEMVKAAEVPAEDLDARIDTILGRMEQFRELMLADPEGANVVLREMIDRVVLHFDNETSARRCRFATGAIYLSECSRLERPEPPLPCVSSRCLRR